MAKKCIIVTSRVTVRTHRDEFETYSAQAIELDDSGVALRSLLKWEEIEDSRWKAKTALKNRLTAEGWEVMPTKGEWRVES